MTPADPTSEPPEMLSFLPAVVSIGVAIWLGGFWALGAGAVLVLFIVVDCFRFRRWAQTCERIREQNRQRDERQRAADFLSKVRP